VNGRAEDRHGWLEFVYDGEPRPEPVGAARTARA
jgi:hypothetical protein